MIIKKEDITNFNKALEGKKTYASGGLLLLFDIFNRIYPDAIGIKDELLITNVLSYLIYYGVIDKAWRNRKDIIDSIKELVDKLKLKLKRND